MKVFKQISFFDKKNKRKLIIQSDRGTAFANLKVYELMKNDHQIIHSMSNSGFKHNSPTESLHGWIKQIFIRTFGDRSKDQLDFLNYFKLFINKWNYFKDINYNINRNK
ncbi:hypothetical protein [Spiroplasma endosymbiont of Aspidapion aeneum]|uniref:hypothetical protein n=1 Tax=Spiroplasma endosymbiont of Aspidapion aeneum TaxID=3066276 RepID=UPI00313D0FF0